MENDIELLNPGLLRPLIDKGITIISVTHFNDILAEIYNESHPKNKINGYMLINSYKGEVYDNLVEKYIDRLEKQIGKSLDISLLPGDIAYTVDCMKIRVIGDRV